MTKIVDANGVAAIPIVFLEHKINLRVHPQAAPTYLILFSLIEHLEIEFGTGLEYIDNLKKNFSLEIKGAEGDLRVGIQKYRKRQLKEDKSE